jgi:hypothetical protein
LDFPSALAVLMNTHVFISKGAGVSQGRADLADGRLLRQLATQAGPLGDSLECPEVILLDPHCPDARRVRSLLQACGLTVHIASASSNLGGVPTLVVLAKNSRTPEVNRNMAKARLAFPQAPLCVIRAFPSNTGAGIDALTSHDDVSAVLRAAGFQLVTLRLA